MNEWILGPVMLPAMAGILLIVFSFLSHRKEKTGEPLMLEGSERKRLHLLVGGVLTVSAVLTLLACTGQDRSLTLFYLLKDIPVYFHIDGPGRICACLTALIWPAVCLYSFSYMESEGDETRFYGFYLLVYACLTGLDFSGNLPTLYVFFEFVTLTSMPLVIHEGTKEAVMAGLKYLFYSMAGAFLGLFGIFFLYHFCDTVEFLPGGSLNPTLVEGNETIFLIAVFAAILGFGVKAGMFPLHAWLTTAHPVSPAPASAVLSGVIVKAGVLCLLRVVYYVAGPDFLRGTWVQTAWMVLSLITVVLGSLMALRTKLFKRRLAYSTVSQVSYILFGLSLLTPDGVTGALLHTVFHAFIKSALFLCAGSMILATGKTEADQYRGVGKEMPGTLWCYTAASLSLIGIPPAAGFLSKWYLAQGALEGSLGAFRYLGPAVLLLSALLTAGYLLPLVSRGFFPGEWFTPGEKKEVSRGMLLPTVFLSALAVLPGIFPGPLLNYVSEIARTLM